MNARTGTRGVFRGSILLIVASLIGVVAASVIGIFVLDRYNAYGEVPVPGSARLHLPAGETTISFHTRIIGSTNGLGLPVPPLQLTIDAPPGVADPVVTEDIGSTTTVNNDARVRVWVAHIAADGDYDITADGKVGGFISPRLAFGYSAMPSRWIWGFVAAFAVGVLGVVVAVVGGRRSRRTGRAEATILGEPAPTYQPSDERIKLEQIKTIAALRDSGALTEAEFRQEKRRILEGQ